MGVYQTCGLKLSCFTLSALLLFPVSHQMTLILPSSVTFDPSSLHRMPSCATNRQRWRKALPVSWIKSCFTTWKMASARMVWCWLNFTRATSSTASTENCVFAISTMHTIKEEDQCGSFYGSIQRAITSIVLALFTSNLHCMFLDSQGRHWHHFFEFLRKSQILSFWDPTTTSGARYDDSCHKNSVMTSRWPCFLFYVIVSRVDATETRHLTKNRDHSLQ